MNYIDYTPDDILSYYILPLLDRDDISSLSHLLTDRSDELFENYIKLMYPDIYHKKTMITQSWYEFLLDILNYNLIPIYKNGKLADYIFILSDGSDIEIKYVDIQNGQVYALFRYVRKNYKYGETGRFVIGIIIYNIGEVQLKIINNPEEDNIIISEGVMLEFANLEDRDDLSDDVAQFHGIPTVNGKIIKQTNILDQLYFNYGSLRIYAFEYKNEKKLIYVDTGITDHIAKSNIIEYSKILRRDIVFIFNVLFGNKTVISVSIKDKSPKEIFDTIFHKLVSEGHYHNFDNYVSL